MGFHYTRLRTGHAAPQYGTYNKVTVEHSDARARIVFENIDGTRGVEMTFDEAKALGEALIKAADPANRWVEVAKIR